MRDGCADPRCDDTPRGESDCPHDCVSIAYNCSRACTADTFANFSMFLAAEAADDPPLETPVRAQRQSLSY